MVAVRPFSEAVNLPGPKVTVGELFVGVPVLSDDGVPSFAPVLVAMTRTRYSRPVVQAVDGVTGA